MHTANTRFVHRNFFQGHGLSLAAKSQYDLLLLEEDAKSKIVLLDGVGLSDSEWKLWELPVNSENVCATFQEPSFDDEEMLVWIVRGNCIQCFSAYEKYERLSADLPSEIGSVTALAIFREYLMIGNSEGSFYFLGFPCFLGDVFDLKNESTDLTVKVGPIKLTDATSSLISIQSREGRVRPKDTGLILQWADGTMRIVDVIGIG